MKNERSSVVPDSAPRTSASRAWPRSPFLLFALLCFAPTALHYRFVDHLLGTTRYPWGLIPIHFLALRLIATLSAWLGFFILAAFAWSFRRSASVQTLLCVSAVISAVFLAAYLCYALFIVAVLLSSRHA